MGIEEVRRSQLRSLIKTHGSQKELASRVGVSSSYIGQMLSGNRPINEKTCKRIERKLGLPSGWLDSSETSRDPIDDEVFVRIVRDIAAITKDSEDWPLEKIASWALRMYRLYVASGDYPNIQQAILLSQMDERKAR